MSTICEYIKSAEREHGTNSREYNLGISFQDTLLNLIGAGEMTFSFKNKLKREGRTSEKLNKLVNSSETSFLSFESLTDGFVAQFKSSGFPSDNEISEYEELVASYSKNYEMIEEKQRKLAVTDIDRINTAELANDFESKLHHYMSEGNNKSTAADKAFEDSLKENINIYFCLVMASVYNPINPKYEISIDNVRACEQKVEEYYSANELRLNR